MELRKDAAYAMIIPTSMGIRITPVNGQPVHSSEVFRMDVTSAESNVGSTSSYLGLPVKILTAFVKGSPIARKIKDNLAGRHMDYEGPELDQGNPWGFRHQINIADSGFGSRGPRVHNDRAGEVGRTLNVKDFDLDRIAAVISSVDPDLVALQEVDFRTNRALNMDLVSELGQRTALVPLFGRAMPYDGGEYGEGILSRYSFVASRCHPLPAQEGKEPRAALEVQVVLPGGDTISFIGTHLDHTRDETDRIAQASKLKDLFSERKMPAILSGDLNARPESSTMSILFEDWTEADPDHEPTIPSLAPKSKIDYILYRPMNRWRVLESRIICDTIASDHCAQLSVLELLPAAH